MEHKEILLTQNRYAIVDDDNYDDLMNYKWHYSLGYAKRFDYSNGKKNPKGIFMHRKILGDIPEGFETDHINGNKLDNRKENLRICRHSDNVKNALKRSKSTSMYKGVKWHKIMKKWQCGIQHNKQRYYLGSFDNEKEAALAYNSRAKELHGEFASLNEVENV